MSVILAILLFSALMITPPSVNAEIGGDWIYEVVDEKATITGYNGTGGNVFIPSEINDKPVIVIGYEAFKNCTSITGVTIPDSVKVIEEGAFEDCSYLTTVRIGNGVESIGSRAFLYTSISSIVIPDSVTFVGYDLFGAHLDDPHPTKMYGITINGKLRLNEDYGFTNVFVTGTEIKRTTFSEYNHVSQLTIADSVTSIESGSFGTFTNLSYLTVRGDAEFDYNYLPKPSSGLSVTGEFVDSANFREWTSMNTVRFENSVKTIGERSFEKCSGLVQVSMEGVETLGDYSFAECSNLKEVSLSQNLTSINDGVFYKCASLNTISLPDKVVSIGNSAFESCWNLPDVAFPSSVKSIGNSAFKECNKMESLVIPKTVNSVGASAFENCVGLRTAYVWGRHTTVGDKAFSECGNVTVYAYDSSPADYNTMNEEIPFVPLLKTNMGLKNSSYSYEDKPLTDTQTTLSDNNGFGLTQNSYGNIETLGTQLKRDDTRKDIRFVSVINEGLVREATIQHDVADYGFVLAKCSKKSTAAAGENNIQKVYIGAPGTTTYSCRNTSNLISDDYGYYNKSTKYKYVTIAINGVEPDQGFVVRFYLKTCSGRVYYSNYSTAYTGIVANFTRVATLREGENTMLFKDEWEAIDTFSDD